MKIEITTDTFINGAPVYPGEVHDVDEATARVLFEVERAKRFVEPTEPAEPGDETKPVENQGAPSGAPASSKRKRRKSK